MYDTCFVQFYGMINHLLYAKAWSKVTSDKNWSFEAISRSFKDHKYIPNMNGICFITYVCDTWPLSYFGMINPFLYSKTWSKVIWCQSRSFKGKFKVIHQYMHMKAVCHNFHQLQTCLITFSGMKNSFMCSKLW